MEIKNDFIEILSSLIDERNKKENILLQCLTMFAELRALKTCLEARTCLENENPCLEKSGSVL